MKNDGQKSQGNGAFRAFSSYLRLVSSGASTVASSVRSAASAIVDRENDAANDQVLWAGFDKLELEGATSRQVLLLAYRSGFQVWDVEEADNVRNLVSSLDGSVSFLQVLPNPVTSKRSADEFAESRPLLAVCADSSLSGGGSAPAPIVTACNRSTLNGDDPFTSPFMPTVVWFYSLRSQSYVHVAKFRSAIYSVRCSSRVVAIAQAAQIHCLDAATLVKEYTILTNPIVTGCSAFGGTGYGPLAVGPRWLAYSGSPMAVSNSGRVNPQQVATSASYPPSPSNGSLVAHFAKESSKQLAAGIVTLGDLGYKKLSRYYSELAPDGHNFLQNGHLGRKPNGTVTCHLPDAENVGMVIVRDMVSKSPIAQFRAHKSPISALCFDPSGTLLVTASIQGHNINVFRIMPDSPAVDSSSSYVHLYTLQRGVTNAVIQDISFSNDSHWIMISSSRGTNHLFAISPYGGPVDFLLHDRPMICRPPNSTSQILNQQNIYAFGPPLTLSVVGRIKSGKNSWRSTVSGAAAAATGKSASFGAIASTFHSCQANGFREDTDSLTPKYPLLVFSSGTMIQYILQASVSPETAGPGLYGSVPDNDVGLVVEAMQKWDICRKNVPREREDSTDIYGENGNSERENVFPEEIRERNDGYDRDSRCSVGKAKISPDEKHHKFISEAELQMHEGQVPLWAKSQIYFHCMTGDGGRIEEECGHGREIEIERIPTRIIETKAKHLVPVFDYLRAPKYHPARTSDLDNNTNTRLVHQTTGPFGNDKLSSRGSSSSLDSMAYGSPPTAQLDNGVVNTTDGWEGLHLPIDTRKGFVNSSDDSPKGKSRLDFVNNRGSAAVEAQIKLVYNNVEGHINMEKHVVDDDVEFD